MGMELLLPALFSPAGAAVAGGMLLGKAMSKGGSAPAAPAVEKPTLMPDPLAQKEALKRKASILQSQQMGRASTVLTDTLGG